MSGLTRMQSFGGDVAGQISGAFTTAWSSISSAGSTVWSGIEGAWEGLNSKATNTANWIKNAFKSAFDELKESGGDIWEGLKSAGASAWEGLQSIGGAISGKQWGGDITKAGMYYLHSGEKVIPTKDAQSGSAATQNNYRTSNFNNMSMTLQAVINTPIDIYEIERRLRNAQYETYRERAGKA